MGPDGLSPYYPRGAPKAQILDPAAADRRQPHPDWRGVQAGLERLDALLAER